MKFDFKILNNGNSTILADILDRFSHNLSHQTNTSSIGITTNNVPFHEQLIDLSPNSRVEVRDANEKILNNLNYCKTVDVHKNIQRATQGSILDRSFKINSFYARRKTTNEKASDICGYSRVMPFKFKSSTTRYTLRELVLNKDLIVSSIESLTMQMLPRGADRGIGSLSSSAVTLPYIRGFVDVALSNLSEYSREAISEMIATCWASAARLNTPSNNNKNKKQPIRDLHENPENSFIIEDIISIMDRMDIDVLNSVLESVNVRLLDDSHFSGIRVLVASIRATLATYIELVDTFLESRPRDDDALGSMLAATLLCRSMNFKDYDFVKITLTRSDCLSALENLQWFIFAKSYTDKADFVTRPEIAELLLQQLRRYLRGGLGSKNRYSILYKQDISELLLLRTFTNNDTLQFANVSLQRNASYNTDVWRVSPDKFLGVSGVGYYGQWSFGNTNITTPLNNNVVQVKNNELNFVKVEKRNSLLQDSLHDKLTKPTFDFLKDYKGLRNIPQLHEALIFEHYLCIISELQDSSVNDYLYNLIYLYTILSSEFIINRINDNSSSILIKLAYRKLYGYREYSTNSSIANLSFNQISALVDDNILFTDDLLSAFFLNNDAPISNIDYDESDFASNVFGVKDNFINFTAQSISSFLVDANTVPSANWLTARVLLPSDFVTRTNNNRLSINTDTFKLFLPNTIENIVNNKLEQEFLSVVSNVTLQARSIVTDSLNLAGYYRYHNSQFFDSSFSNLRKQFNEIIAQLHVYDHYANFSPNVAIEIKDKRHYNLPTRQLSPSIISTLSLENFLLFSSVYDGFIPIILDQIKNNIMALNDKYPNIVSESEIMNFLINSSIFKFLLKQYSLVFLNKVWSANLEVISLCNPNTNIVAGSLLDVIVPHARLNHASNPAPQAAIDYIYNLFNIKTNENIFGGIL